MSLLHAVSQAAVESVVRWALICTSRARSRRSIRPGGEDVERCAGDHAPGPRSRHASETDTKQTSRTPWFYPPWLVVCAPTTRSLSCRAERAGAERRASDSVDTFSLSTSISIDSIW